MEKIPFTQLGLDKLKAELTNLKSVERQAVIRAIAEAREHGNLRKMPNITPHVSANPLSKAASPSWKM